MPVSAGPLGPLDLQGCRALADALADTPETAISVHLLRNGFCRAYVAGGASASLRVAQKLGFTEVSRRTYVIKVRNN